MLDYHLNPRQLAELRAAHRAALNVREAYRLNAVILLAEGWTAAQVGQALLLDPDSVRTYFKRYQQGGLDELLRLSFIGSEALLADAELRELDAHLHLQLHLTVASVVHWVEERFGVRYSLSGMTALLHRLRYVYKKAKLIPGKADSALQEAFVDEYEKLKENKGHDEVILFMDATHPLHNPVAGNGWIKRGADFPIPSNTGRRRLNINGVIDIERLSATIRFEETVNAVTTIDLLKQIEIAYSQAPQITIICDNARYYRAKAVTAYLENSRIALKFLPAYSPNLNLIERFWKFFKRNVLYNHYYPTFAEYKKACQGFFDNLDSHAKELGTLLTENFEIIRN
jgi:transposase